MRNRFKKMIESASNILISTHLHPDADGIGSEIALCMALRTMGKKVYCINEEELLERYKYLDPDDTVHSVKTYNKMVKEGEIKDQIDLFIVVDTNTLSRIGNKVERLVEKAEHLLFIDHHPCPKELMSIHCIDTASAATGELVGYLIEYLGIEFNEAMARALYTAILIDTSSFRYPTVTGTTHKLLAKLLDTGVKPPKAYNKIYGTKKVSYMQLLGMVLSSAQTTKDGSIAWLILDEASLKKYNVDTEDTHGFINHLLILDNIKVAVMFRQKGNSVKISLRSAGGIDVGIMAQALGGGGHNHSAATIVEGELKKVIKNTVEKIELMLA